MARSSQRIVHSTPCASLEAHGCYNRLRPVEQFKRKNCCVSAARLSLNQCLLIGVFIFCCLLSTGYSATVKTGCRKHGTQHVIDEPGCDLVAVNINMCSGYCMSFSYPNPGENSITVHGKCCRMVDTEWIDVKVNCDDGERKMRIPSALECRCFDCA
ncbi:hypothetical protein Tcan_14220 [Toxocara canis]|uniref:CTCK domain-containing protein n=1 Tax=Toxocara canis TaxID=6265 RepID=A0A0B2VNB0_TOXCA|nr:hypothetical protein Tcan_14220 [Toxocara canis]